MDNDNLIDTKSKPTIMLPNKLFIVLLVITAIALQSMILWKVIGLEKEEMAISQERNEFEKDKAKYSELFKKIPELENQENSLKESIAILTNDKKKIEDEYSTIKEAKFRAEEIIAKSKEAKKINTELTEAVDNLKKEIENKVVEIKSLTTPSSDLMQSAGTLLTIVKQLEDQPASFKQELMQSVSKVDNYTKELMTTSAKLTEQSKSIFTASETMTSKFQDLAQKSEAATKSVEESDKNLKLHTKSFSEELGFLNKRITEIGTNNTKISEQIKNLLDISQKVSDASDKVHSVSIKAQESADNFDKKINTISFESQKTLLENRIVELETNNKNAASNISELNNIIIKIADNQKNIEITSKQIQESSGEFKNKVTSFSLEEEKKQLNSKIYEIDKNNKSLSDKITKFGENTESLSLIKTQIEGYYQQVTASLKSLDQKIQAISFQDEKALLLAKIKDIEDNTSKMKLQVGQIEEITSTISTSAKNTMSDFTNTSEQLSAVNKEFDLIITGLNQVIQNTSNTVEQFKERVGSYTEKLNQTELEQLNSKIKTELSNVTEYSDSVKNSFSQLALKVNELKDSMENYKPEKSSDKPIKAGEPK
ncbi:MAG: hypothetical protein HQK63_13690 [Desulfamplus sp.]|nr:hypothetical protein [Desulfamplus sp.]